VYRDGALLSLFFVFLSFSPKNLFLKSREVFFFESKEPKKE